MGGKWAEVGKIINPGKVFSHDKIDDSGTVSATDKIGKGL